MARPFWAAALVLVATGCTASPPAPAPGPQAAPVLSSAPALQPARTPLDGLRVEDLVPDSRGQRFLVMDRDRQLYLAEPGGQTPLGKGGDMPLLAAWGPNDYGYAFARQSADGRTYEIVGVGHEGSKVLAVAKGYPGALHFAGSDLHFIDAEGWKVVDWDAKPVLKASMPLGYRTNQAAWCAWPGDEPLCVGGYWDPHTADDNQLTLVSANGERTAVVNKGEHIILAGAAFSRDARLMAAILGARSNGASSPGRVVVAWLDVSGRPTRVQDFPILAAQVAFDGANRLLLRQFRDDGSGPGALVVLDPETGTTRPVQANVAPYRFAVAPEGKQLYAIFLGGTVTAIP